MKPGPIVHAHMDTTQAYCGHRLVQVGTVVIESRFVPFDAIIPANMHIVTPERLARIEALRDGKASALLFELAVLAGACPSTDSCWQWTLHNGAFDAANVFPAEVTA